MATLAKRLKKREAIRQRRDNFASGGRIVEIYEYLDMSTVGKGTVDRIRAFIPHVKVLGKFSPNKHGISGVKGTIYEPSAIEQARELLESGIGNKVCMGHPPRENPDAERKPGEPNGMLVNPRIESGELFADWQLIPSHPMSSQLLDCAENPLLSSQYSMSVNARGYGVPKNDHWCVTHFEPPYIRGTDCVTKGGACTNLRESAETTMKKPFKQVIAVSSQSVKDWWANAGKRAKSLNLMEDYEAMGDMPVEAPTEDAAVADMGWKNHLGNLLKSIVEDPEMDPKMMREKITAALKCLEEGEQGEGDEEAADLEEGDEDGDEEMPKKDAMESLRVEVKALRDKEHVRDLCESWNPSPTQFKALVAMQDDADRKALIAELKAVKKPASGGTFSSSSRTILESREQQRDNTDDYKDQSPEARKKRLARLKS